MLLSKILNLQKNEDVLKSKFKIYTQMSLHSKRSIAMRKVFVNSEIRRIIILEM